MPEGMKNLRLLPFYTNRFGGATFAPSRTHCLFRRGTIKMSKSCPSLRHGQAASSPLPSLIDLMPLEPAPLDRRRRINRREAGFTLLELLVVLAILGLLIGLVAPRVLGVFGTAKEKIARLNIAGLGTDHDMYKLDVGSYPTTDEGLQALLVRPAGVAHWDGP